MAGTRFDVADINRVVASLGKADDFALVQSALTGNDLAFPSNFSDSFDARSGNDLVFGNAGNDKVLLGAGKDIAIGGFGKDSLVGGIGHDALIGNEGNDSLSGGNDNDLIDGGKGDDLLNGGAGADIFYFLRSDGRDVIEGYLDGTDKINIGSGATGFGQLQINQSGTDTIITFATNEITLNFVQASSLHASDFTFRQTLANSKLEAFVVGWDFIA